jgi:hypothetical protein
MRTIGPALVLVLAGVYAGQFEARPITCGSSSSRSYWTFTREEKGANVSNSVPRCEWPIPTLRLRKAEEVEFVDDVGITMTR